MPAVQLPIRGSLRTPEEQSAADTAFTASQQRLDQMVHRDRAAQHLDGHRQAFFTADADDSKDAFRTAPSEEVDRDNSGAFESTAKGKGRARPASFALPAPARQDKSESGEDSDGENVVWKVYQPQPQPLRFQGPTAKCGSETRQVSFPVDFTNKASVHGANKRRRQEVYRAKSRHGLKPQPLRPMTKGRDDTQAHDDYIVQQHTEYAVHQDNTRISWGIRTNNFNARFPEQNPSKSLITSHVDHHHYLKDVRAQYDGVDES
jgi:hypothetical protein